MEPESVTFSLANETFTLNTGLPDKVRREQHYKDGSTTLSPEEQRILDSLGINSGMEDTLRPYMPSFFDALPQCNTDASVMLNKECEVPYYVLWSTLFADRTFTGQRVAENKKNHTSRSMMNMAQDGALLDELKPRKTKKDLYAALFTLIPAIPADTSLPAQRTDILPVSNGPRPSAPPASNTGPKPSAPPASNTGPRPSAPSAPTPGVDGPVVGVSPSVTGQSIQSRRQQYEKLFTLIPKPVI